MPTTDEVTAADYQLSTEHGKMEVFHHSDASHDERYKALMTSVSSGVGDTGLDNPEVSILFSPKNRDDDYLLSFKKWPFKSKTPMVQMSLVKIAAAKDGTRSMSSLCTDTQVMSNVIDIKEALSSFFQSILTKEPTQSEGESGFTVLKDLATWFDADTAKGMVAMGRRIADGLSTPLGSDQPRIVIVPGTYELLDSYKAAWKKYPYASSLAAESSKARDKEIQPFLHIKDLEHKVEHTGEPTGKHKVKHGVEHEVQHKIKTTYDYKFISMYDANKPEMVVSLAISTSKPRTISIFASYRRIRLEKSSGYWGYRYQDVKDVSVDGIEEAIKAALEPALDRPDKDLPDEKQSEDAEEWKKSRLGPYVEAMLAHEFVKDLFSQGETVQAEVSVRDYISRFDA